MDPLQRLKKDHTTVKGLFKKIDKAEKPAQKRELFGQIRAELERHTGIEERALYPALKAHEQVAELVNESYQEHHVVDLLIGEIARLQPDDEAFDAKVTVLQENVEHHIEEEEKELFKLAKKLLGEAELADLGRLLDAEKAPAGGRH